MKALDIHSREEAERHDLTIRRAHGVLSRAHRELTGIRPPKLNTSAVAQWMGRYETAREFWSRHGVK